MSYENLKLERLKYQSLFKGRFLKKSRDWQILHVVVWPVDKSKQDMYSEFLGWHKGNWMLNSFDAEYLFERSDICKDSDGKIIYEDLALYAILRNIEKSEEPIKVELLYNLAIYKEIIFEGDPQIIHP